MDVRDDAWVPLIVEQYNSEKWIHFSWTLLYFMSSSEFADLIVESESFWTIVMLITNEPLTESRRTGTICVAPLNSPSGLIRFWK
jgi:hypothetical protein